MSYRKFLQVCSASRGYDMAMPAPFIEALAAGGPHPSLGVHAATYGRFIGSWTGEARYYPADGSTAISSVEIHFAWALNGRAVQDVWIAPARPDRAAGAVSKVDLYGSTLRIFDPSSESWRVVWWNPVIAKGSELEGRRQGDDVVQLGVRDGQTIRWTFSEVRDDSFLWQGHALQRDGATWRLEAEFRVRRSPVIS